jgi:hypothetical protein
MSLWPVKSGGPGSSPGNETADPEIELSADRQSGRSADGLLM